MGQPVTFAAVAGLALAGTGIGLYLGESAVEQIDPIHYGSYGGTRFFADLVPNPPDRGAPPPAFENAPLPTDYGSGCIGCRRASVDNFRPYEVPVYDAAYATADIRAPTPDEIVADVEAQIAAADAAARAARAEVLRYAHFQVAAVVEEEHDRFDAKSVRAARPDRPTSGDCLIEDQCAGRPTPGI